MKLVAKKEGGAVSLKRLEFCCTKMMLAVISDSNSMGIDSPYSSIYPVKKKYTKEDFANVMKRMQVCVGDISRVISLCPWCGEKIEGVLEE